MSCGLTEEVRSVGSSLISVVVSDSPAGWEAGAGAVGRAGAPKLRKSPRGGSGAVLGHGLGGLVWESAFSGRGLGVPEAAPAASCLSSQLP